MARESSWVCRGVVGRSIAYRETLLRAVPHPYAIPPTIERTIPSLTSDLQALAHEAPTATVLTGALAASDPAAMFDGSTITSEIAAPSELAAPAAELCPWAS